MAMPRPPHAGPGRRAVPRGRHAGGPRLALVLAQALALGAALPPAAARPAAQAGPATAVAASPGPAAAASAAGAASAPPPPGGRFNFYGLKPAAAGQRLADAEAALGQPLKPLPPLRARAAAAPASAATSAAAVADCHYRSSDAQPGVRYALAGGVITRVETRDPRYATVSGVRVGDTLARVQQAYGKRLQSAPHPYFDKGQMLTVPAPDRRHALVLESNDQGRIITLRSGRVPEVTWLEGCAL